MKEVYTSRISSHDLISSKWASTPQSLKAYSEYIEALSGYVTDSILGEFITESTKSENILEISRLISFFVGIANRCYKNRNFSTAICIMTALDDVNISRITEAFTQLTNREEFDALVTLFDCRKNFTHLRSKMDECLHKKRRYIPYLPLVQRDIEIYSKSVVEDIIKPTEGSPLFSYNYDKLFRICDIIRNFITSQGLWKKKTKKTYSTTIVQLCHTHPSRSNEERRARSLILHPHLLSRHSEETAALAAAPEAVQVSYHGERCLEKIREPIRR